MRLVFVDAGHWIALWNPQDALHQRAVVLSGTLQDAQLVTTQFVLTETLDFMASAGEFRRLYAAQMVRDLERNPNIEIIPQTAAQFRAAVERYSARSDQRWSMTDCASFMAMEERGITEALAYDRHFEQAGFRALLREDPA